MKTCLVAGRAMLAVLMVFVFAGSVGAAEKATKDECVAKVEQAAKLIQQIGMKAALEKIMDESGPYRWKDSYVFCMDEDMGRLLAHPMTTFIGFPMKTWKDADGKLPFVRVLDEIQTREKGWVRYNYQAPGAESPKMKATYYLKVPGQKAVIAAGYME